MLCQLFFYIPLTFETCHDRLRPGLKDNFAPLTSQGFQICASHFIGMIHSNTEQITMLNGWNGYAKLLFFTIHQHIKNFQNRHPPGFRIRDVTTSLIQGILDICYFFGMHNGPQFGFLWCWPAKGVVVHWTSGYVTVLIRCQLLSVAYVTPSLALILLMWWVSD